MARLPQPGSDDGTWGTVLNDYLSQAHNTDGTLKDDIVGSDQLQPGSVIAASIADGVIAETKLDSGVQTKLNQSPTIADGSVTPPKLAATTAAGTKSASAPVSPAVNDLWYDVTNDMWKRWNGSAWVAASSDLAPTAARNPVTGWFHVDGYGADRTGSANASTAIASAITAAAAVSGTVYFPPGTYLIGAAINLASNVTLMGAGRGRTKLVAGSGLTTALIVGVSGSAVSNVTICDLSLDGSYATLALNLNGIQITNGSYVTIQNCGLKNLGVAGVLLQGLNAGGGTPHSAVRDCVIESTGLSNGTTGFGVLIKDASSYCTVSGNDISGVSGGMGIGGNGAAGTGFPTHLSIIGNTILMAPSSTGFEAIGLTAGCTSAVISNNSIFESRDNGISASADWATVTGNSVNGTVNHGIYSGGNFSTITGNFIRNVGKAADATYGGISLSTNNNNVVVGNVMVDDQAVKTAAHGVKVVTSGGNHLIALNTVNGFTTSAYTGLISTDKLVDSTSQTNGLAFNTLYLNTLAGATSGQAIAVSSDVRLNSRAYTGSSTISLPSTAQHTFGSNLPASRPNAGFVAVFNQWADMWQGATTAADNTTTTVVSGMSKTGRVYSNDGLTTKDLGDVSALTSAQIDALFAAVPPDGTLASGIHTAAPVMLTRRNGKWNYVAMTVIT